MRQELEASIGPEYELAATILARLRPVVHAAEPDQEARARMFAGLVDGPLLDALRAHDAGAVDRILAGAVGGGTTLAALGVSGVSMELLLLKVALVAYLLAVGALALHLLIAHPGPRMLGLGVLSAAFVAHGGAIMVRSFTGGYIAVTTDYEALSFFAWLIVGVYLARRAALSVAGGGRGGGRARVRGDARRVRVLQRRARPAAQLAERLAAGTRGAGVPR